MNPSARTTILWNELKSIIVQWAIWFTLAKTDIKLRYRRSFIGPLWFTISTAITIYALGFLYPYLFKINTSDYLPYLAAGIIGWALISSLLTESANAFIESEHYIKNQHNPLSIFIMRIIQRNMIIFFHNLLALIPLFFIKHLTISFNLLLLIPGLLIIAINAFLWGNILAIIGTRYRDFGQILTSFIQISFFLTPIMWLPKLIPEHRQWAILYNPFNQFLNIIRNPIINQSTHLSTLYILTSFTLLGFVFYCFIMGKYNNKIVFWL